MFTAASHPLPQQPTRGIATQSESALQARNWAVPPSISLPSMGPPVMPAELLVAGAPASAGADDDALAVVTVGAVAEAATEPALEVAAGTLTTGAAVAVVAGGVSVPRAHSTHASSAVPTPSRPRRFTRADTRAGLDQTMMRPYTSCEGHMRELKGKVAVVTGAASGIGKAMAARFGREGMRVVLADVEEQPLLATREEFTRAGVESIAMRCDVSQWLEVQALAARAFDAFGAVHVLCNNAGIGVGGPIWDVPLTDWQWVMGVNLWGVVHGIKAFVPSMIAHGDGHVVNTASIAGLISAPGMGPYCATKHAVVAMSECLHHDLRFMAGSKVGVSVLCPAWVKTRIADSERNRPASAPGAPASSRPPQAAMFDGMIRQAIAGGIPPEDVAEQVLSAVRENRFWVLTHPKTHKTVERRFAGIVAGTPPEFDPSQL